MLFLEKLRKIRENIEILNLSQQERERIIQDQKPNYYTIRYFTQYLLAIEVKKIADAYE